MASENYLLMREGGLSHGHSAAAKCEEAQPDEVPYVNVLAERHVRFNLLSFFVI
jgi:hypothetical protein